MKTNIEIDDKLMEKAFAVSKARTKKELIQEALVELVRLRSRKDLTELAGTIGFSKGFDHKKLRKTRNDIG